MSRFFLGTLCGTLCKLALAAALLGCSDLDVRARASAQAAAVPSRPASPPASPASPSPVPPSSARARTAAPCPPQTEWPKGMACVLGGSFELGDARGRRDEKPPGAVYVDTFYMDLTEVTNAAYAPCIESGRCKVPKPYKKFAEPEQPVVAVSWFDAVAHCELLGKRLPTEAEWERAASGPEHTRYPWGKDARECEATVIETEAGEGCGTKRTAKVGSRPAGHFGLYDMAGNVHEWVNDFYSPCLRGCEHECGDACFGDNPRGPCGGISPCRGYGLRSVRGGSWFWPLERARSTARRGSGAPNRGPHRFGFRCASDL